MPAGDGRVTVVCKMQCLYSGLEASVQKGQAAAESLGKDPCFQPALEPVSPGGAGESPKLGLSLRLSPALDSQPFSLSAATAS